MHFFSFKKTLSIDFFFLNEADVSARYSTSTARRIVLQKKHKVRSELLFKKFFKNQARPSEWSKLTAAVKYRQKFLFKDYLHTFFHPSTHLANLNFKKFKKNSSVLVSFYKKKNFLVFFFIKQRMQIKLISTGAVLIKKQSIDFTKNSLLFLSVFFKLKNFFFLNNFFFFLSFFPAGLLDLLFSKARVKDLMFNVNFFFERKFSTWQLFFLESATLLDKKSFFLTFFYMFLARFIEMQMQTKACLVIKNLSFSLSNLQVLSSWLSNRVDTRFRAFNRFFFFIEFLDVLLLAFFKKDVLLLESWFSRFLRKLHFKLHKNFLFLCNKFFRQFFGVFKLYFGIKGLKIDFRGKVSVSGNAKKRHFLIHFGKVSFSKKMNRVSYAHNTISTKTGVCGLEVILVY